MSFADNHVYDKLILPRESGDFLNRMKNVLDINLYLLQNRFCYEKPVGSKGNNYKKNGDEENSPKKYGSLLRLGMRNGGINYREIYAKEAVGLIERLNDQNKKIAQNFMCFSLYKLEPYNKLIIGESGSVYHDIQPLRLHPLFGVPYIPASVIKGTLRSIWVMEQNGGNEEKAEESDDFIQLFGGKRKDGKCFDGKLIFFDIFPEKFTIELDIQNIHYKGYYDNPNRQQPTDDQSTIPVLFVCLKETIFPIFIASSDKDVWKHWQKKIDDMVRCMFMQYGIGAKTALGYGIGSLDLM